MAGSNTSKVDARIAEMYGVLNDGIDNIYEEFPDCELISSAEMCEKVGISMRQIDYWTTKGYVTPIVESPGSGNARMWGDYQIGEVVEVREKKRGY